MKCLLSCEIEEFFVECLVFARAACDTSIARAAGVCVCMLVCLYACMYVCSHVCMSP